MVVCMVSFDLLSLFEVISVADASVVEEVNRLSAFGGQMLTAVRLLAGALLFSVFFFFFWGVARYLRKGDGAVQPMKNMILWGVLGIFVLLSLWGLVHFFRDSIFVSGSVEQISIQKDRKDVQ